MREIGYIRGCITPSRVIILRQHYDVYLPIIVIDRMNPGTPQKLLETPGMRCKAEDVSERCQTLHKYNHLMIVVEAHYTKDSDETNLISYWDLRDEPYIFKEHNIIDMIPSEILSEYELGKGVVGNSYSIRMQLSRAIMAVAIEIEYCVTPYQNLSSKSVLLLYRVNTTEPSQDAEGFHLLKTMKLADNIIPLITMNDKYLIHKIVNGGKFSPEVHEIETLLSSMDTRIAPRKILPQIDGEYELEPGMSDRFAVFHKVKNLLTIFDLVSRNPTTIVDTIQWSIIGQPSQKKFLPDKKLKIQSIGGNWCCGSFLILQRLELPNRCKKHRQWTFKLNIVDPGTVEKRPEVISHIKEICDSKISYPKRIGGEVEICYIDVMGIVYVVNDTSGDADYLTVNCAQFHNINAAQAGYIRALEDSSGDKLCGLNAVDEVVNWKGKREEGMGEGGGGESREGEGRWVLSRYFFFSFTFLLAYTITNKLQD